MEVNKNKFVARQAILDTNRDTFGYELLFRSGFENYFKGEAEDQATSLLILQNHIMGNIEELSLGAMSFINFDERSLLARLPELLNKDKAVIEILETVEVTDKIVSAISTLFDKGYKLALDDYDFKEKWIPLFPFISYIKIDLECITLNQIETLMRSELIETSSIKVLVERVETETQFNTLKEMGVELFQGYFFHKPELVAGYCVEPTKLTLLELFSESCQPVLDYDKLSSIVTHDVGLTNGILKLVNLDFDKSKVEITSIKQAIAYLGEYKVRQFIGIVAMSKLASSTTNELLLESLIRAKTMESISVAGNFKTVNPMAFITGMLSNLGAILKQSDREVIEKLPLHGNVKDALILRKGVLFDLLTIVMSFESKTVSERTNRLIEQYQLNESLLVQEYHKSLKWCLTFCS